MTRMFQILAVALAIAAAFFVWRGDLDTAFAVGVLAICAFFLAIRFIFKTRISERDSERQANEPDDSEESPETTD
jgi:Ca2+/Na+ antiporter